MATEDRTVGEIGEALRFYSQESVPNFIFASVKLSKEGFDGAIPTSFFNTRLMFENKGGVIFTFFCHEYVLRILKKIITDEKSLDDDIIKDLVLFLKQEQHIKAIQSLKNSQSEAEIQSVLAHHLFAPLVPTSTYMISGRCKYLDNCFACNERVSVGDTSLGHPHVWHGCPDILIAKSTVNIKVCNNEVNEDGDQLGYEEDLNSGVPHCIAQTITNAFYVVKNNPHLVDYYIPSFLSTSKSVIIVMYNCKRDRLFMSEDLLFFDENTGKVNIATFTTIWLTLSFDRLFKPVPDQEFEKMNIAISNFLALVGETLSLYQNDLSRPLVNVERKKAVKRKCKIAPEMYSLEIEYFKRITEGFKDIEHLIRQREDIDDG